MLPATLFGVVGIFVTVAIKSAYRSAKDRRAVEDRQAQLLLGPLRDPFSYAALPSTQQSEIAMGELTYCVLGKLTELCASF